MNNKTKAGCNCNKITSYTGIPQKGITNKYFIKQPGQDSLTGILTPVSSADTSFAFIKASYKTFMSLINLPPKSG